MRGRLNMRSFLKWLWVFLSLTIYIFAVYFLEYKHTNDSEIFLIYAMLVVCFPLGLLAPLLLSLLPNTSSAGISLTWLTLEWFVFIFFGWIQWFIFVPRISNFIKRKKSI